MKGDRALNAVCHRLRDGVVARGAAAAQRRGAVDDEGDPIVGRWDLVEDPAALAALRARFDLPAEYDEFLARHSSHAYVDAGLRRGDVAVWLAPVDTVAAVTDACAFDRRLGRDWVVCATGPQGVHAIATAEPGAPVMFLHESARPPVVVAPNFVAFLQLVARDTEAAPKDMPRRSAPPTPPAGHGVRVAASAALLLALLVALARWSGG